MTRNDLYQLAFRYKKTGLWKKLWDTDVFALRLSSGKTGFVNIMGMVEEYCAIGLYIGDEGFRSFRIVANADRWAESDLEYHELMVQQNCLQLVFGRKDDLSPEEVEEVRAYAKVNKIRLNGKNTYPQFVKCEPNRLPWKVKTEEDLQALYEAVEASLLLSELIGDSDPAFLGIFGIEPDTKEVPLFEVKENRLQSIGYAALPEDVENRHKPLILKNDILKASIKRIPKKGIWEAEFVRMMQPIQGDGEDAPYFPSVLLLAESDSHFVLPVLLDLGEEENAEVFFQKFYEAWKSQNVCAKEIRCRNERTYAMLKDVCEKIGVKVQIYDGELEAIDEALDTMAEGLDDEDMEMVDQLSEVAEAILEMTPAEIREIPKPMLLQLKEMVNMGIFPPDIADQMRRKLRGI